jgi:hypothetical protein
MKKENRNNAVTETATEEITEVVIDTQDAAEVVAETTAAPESVKAKRGRKPKATENEPKATATENEVAPEVSAEASEPVTETKATGRRGKPQMTWTQRGFIFNGEAIQLIGAPQYVIFELDEDAKRLTVKEAGDIKPRFSFATSEKRSKLAFITAGKFREAIGKLLGIQPDAGGVHFEFNADESGKVGVIDLTPTAA